MELVHLALGEGVRASVSKRYEPRKGAPVDAPDLIPT
jgi:hypothetical protein